MFRRFPELLQPFTYLSVFVLLVAATINQAHADALDALDVDTRARLAVAASAFAVSEAPALR